MGIVIGVIFVVVAFFPKFTALLIAIPAPVASAYITVLIGMLFVQGMKIIIQDGVDHRKAVFVGLRSMKWLGRRAFPDANGSLRMVLDRDFNTHKLGSSL